MHFTLAKNNPPLFEIALGFLGFPTFFRAKDLDIHDAFLSFQKSWTAIEFIISYTPFHEKSLLLRHTKQAFQFVRSLPDTAKAT